MAHRTHLSNLLSPSPLSHVSYLGEGKHVESNPNCNYRLVTHFVDFGEGREMIDLIDIFLIGIIFGLIYGIFTSGEGEQ